jgi:plasmid stabilization system protein ParE
MTSLFVSPRARQQVVSIDAWWRENRSAASEMFSRALASAFERLTANPLAGPRYVGPDAELGADFEVRRLLLRRCRYHVYYHFDPDLDRIDVLAVWHTSRGHGPELE